MFSCKRWTSMNFVRSELTVETLASPIHGKIILKVHVPNKKGTWLPCFESIWSLNVIKMPCYSACSLLLFLFRTSVRKDTWMRTASVIVTVIFFENVILNINWSQLCSKSLLHSYEAHWQQHFEWYTTLVYFTIMINMRAKSFIKTSLNVTEMRIDEGAWKKIVTQSMHLKEHFPKQKPHFTYFTHFFFSQI